MIITLPRKIANAVQRRPMRWLPRGRCVAVGEVRGLAQDGLNHINPTTPCGMVKGRHASQVGGVPMAELGVLGQCQRALAVFLQDGGQQCVLGEATGGRRRCLDNGTGPRRAFLMGHMKFQDTVLCCIALCCTLLKSLWRAAGQMRLGRAAHRVDPEMGGRTGGWTSAGLVGRRPSTLLYTL